MTASSKAQFELTALHILHTHLPCYAHPIVFEGQSHTLQPIQSDTGGAHRQA